jgi:hypothetical protein
MPQAVVEACGARRPAGEELPERVGSPVEVVATPSARAGAVNSAHRSPGPFESIGACCGGISQQAPMRSRKGVLARMTGDKTLGELARDVPTRFPEQFKTSQRRSSVSSPSDIADSL